MSKTAKVIIVLVLCLAVLGGIAGVVAWTQSDKFDQKDVSYLGKYEVGGLDSAGNYMSTNASIYTKKPIECQGLNCNLVFDSTISYQLYFYDQNNDFVHTTGRLTGTFVEESAPFFAKYVRIVITPKDDDKITSLEVNKYAKQLKVSVNREQGFKNYTENLLFFNHAGKILSSTGTLVDSSTAGSGNVSDFVDIQPYNEALYFKHAPNSSWGTGITIAFYDTSKNFIMKETIHNVTTVVFTASSGIVYNQFKVGEFPEGTCYIRIGYEFRDADFEFMCR